MKVSTVFQFEVTSMSWIETSRNPASSRRERNVSVSPSRRDGYSGRAKMGQDALVRTSSMYRCRSILKTLMATLPFGASTRLISDSACCSQIPL